ncbi:hypothetical protein [Mangrovimonas aestuarii]|uniref:hypothetical protein n=1 Tax=Mangrovimonas aestuarii TaxID=3018443 RepID=UPI00237882D6|nr:hypothetical protein [Mangrovimonas aestuarii]
MTLLQRVGYYLGGFSIGLVVLFFFLTGKKVSCSYGPESRVKKNILTKTMMYSDSIKILIQNKSIDTVQLREALRTGDINFSESNTRKEPCGIYLIEGSIKEETVKLTVENCDSIATVKRIFK